MECMASNLAYEAKGCQILNFKIIDVSFKFGILIGVHSFGDTRFEPSIYHINHQFFILFFYISFRDALNVA